MQALIAERRTFGRKSDMKEITDKPQFSGFGYSVCLFSFVQLYPVIQRLYLSLCSCIVIKLILIHLDFLRV